MEKKTAIFWLFSSFNQANFNGVLNDKNMIYQSALSFQYFFRELAS